MSVTVKCPMHTGVVVVEGREVTVFNQHAVVDEASANILASRPGYAIVGQDVPPPPEALPVRHPGVRVDAQPVTPQAYRGAGRYRLRCPMQSGIALINGRSYEVQEHTTWVEDLETANFAVSQLGYMMLGMERWKTVDRVLVQRNGGLGDILMLTPIFRAMKKANPGLRITLACLENFMEVLRYVPSVDKIVPMVGGHSTGGDGYVDALGESYPLWLNMENIAERLQATAHRVDIFAQVAGFDNGIPDKQLDYRISDVEWEWAAKRMASIGVKPGDRVLALGLRTTCFNRNLPGTDNNGGVVSNVNREIAQLAARDGWKVMLVDHDARFGWEGDNILNMTGRLTHRELGALMGRCQMYVGPDTGTWHMACALRMPNVVYFGAIDYRLRVTSSMTRVVAKAVSCYPCNTYGCHNRAGVVCIDFTAQEVWDAAREKWAAYQVNPAIRETLESGREAAAVVRTEDMGYAGPPGIPQEVLDAN